MSGLVYAQEADGRLSLVRLEEGSPLGDGSFDALLVSRLDCDLRLVDLPPVADRELEGLLRYRLRSIYPGNPEDTVLDHRIIGEGSDRQALLLIARRETLERYRSLAGNRRLVLPFSLIGGLARGREALRVWFCTRDWQELLVYRKGRLVSSSVSRRERDDGGALFRAEDGLPPELRDIPAICVLAQSGTPEVPAGMTTVAIGSLGGAIRKAEGVFGVQSRRKRLLRPGVLIAALGAAIAVLGVLVFLKYVGLEERRVAALRASYRELEGVSGRILAIQREVDALQAEIDRLEARRPQNLGTALSSLGEVLGKEAVISTLVIRGDAFQVEAVGENSLRLMEEFRTREQFQDVRLSQVFPDPRTGKERFSFSGSFRAR